MATRLRSSWPALVALLVAGTYAVWRMAAAGWDPVALAQLGAPPPGQGWSPDGYDGQFTYYMAWDLDPATVADHLDVPAYRYQRILLPLVARLLSLGSPVAIPWALLLVNLASHGAGAFAVAQLMRARGKDGKYALTYALWAGLIAGVGLDLTEPLAYALIALGWWAREEGRRGLGNSFLSLGLFAKETCLLFWLPAVIGDSLRSSRRRDMWPLFAGGGLFLAWQAWLWLTFGVPGIGSGGALATSFEVIPFMGLLRIGTVSLRALAVFLAIFGPTIVAPTVWGCAASVRAIVAGHRSSDVWALLLNSMAVVALPFSTFREPLGLVRVASGLVLAVLLFAGQMSQRRVLNYSLFWCALLAMLLRG